MTYPPDNHRDLVRGMPIEYDAHIVNGSILAIAAFAIVVIGIAWHAVTGHRTESIGTSAFERAAPDSTTGYGAARPKVRSPSLPPK
ncbi:MAG: hypothetical protein GEU95_00950 [Rhizobiales bacterium]|nr:hypothetical protein [Hyphomicrobiales bacterium]